MKPDDISDQEIDDIIRREWALLTSEELVANGESLMNASLAQAVKEYFEQHCHTPADVKKLNLFLIGIGLTGLGALRDRGHI
jgi:hypothetical protein